MGDRRPRFVLQDRLRGFLRRLIDADVVSQPRYRAWERSHVRTATRAGAAVLIVVLLFDAAAMSSAAPAITALNLPLAAVGAALLLVLRLRSGPRRNPTGAAILLGVTALLTSLLPLGLVPEAGTIQIAYVPLVIVASALFIPWNTVRHLAWTGVCLAIVFGFVLSPFAATLGDATIGDLLTITIDSVLVSLGGHLVLQRQRRSMFLQKMQLRGLNELAAQQGRDLRNLAEELREAARVDPLTGVANRLRLGEDLEMVAGRDVEHGDGAALMIDIDRFKDYNDRHGHLAGDTVLRLVAETLAAHSRPSDRVYRFGGEEFLVLLPGATIIDALAVAERQRVAVEELAIRTDRPGRSDDDEVVTISLGVAPLGHGSSANPSDRADEWLRAADAAMYESKVNGRNRVTVAHDDAPGGAAVA
jgi:diguanylate cyclase (GGDEF)-like protein